MKRPDFTAVVLLGVILGAIFFYGGFFAATYRYEEGSGFLTHYYKYPYSDYALPLLTAGTTLVVVSGLLYLWRARRELAETGKEPARHLSS